MSQWECGVCGYLHKESNPPEKCPICEAPGKMFIEKPEDTSEPEVELKTDDQVEATELQETPHEKQWRCTVSGYLHTGPEPPEKCPVCDATAEQFEEVIEVVEEATEEVAKKEPPTESNRRWRCTVCGYIHQGEEAPDKCPMCGADKKLFVEVDAEGKSLAGEEDVEAATIVSGGSGVEVGGAQKGSTFFDKLSTLVLKLHLHPIHTHFPNGILPVIVVFLGLAIYFNIAALETAAFFNSIAVLVILPVVILTGYIEWQKRYKGIKTAVFITKIICSLIVLASVNILVFWRVIDPTVAAEGSAWQMIYFAVAAVALGAAGIAGHLGGKLVFAGRN
ncbi:MAG: rubrerythrin [Desulforhopalus sp.]|jgi:rubrerythrin